VSVPSSLVRSKAAWVPPVHTVASRRVPIVGPRATDRLHRAPGYPRAFDRSCPFESRQNIPAGLGMGTVATRVCCCCCRDFAEISAERKHCCRVARIFRVPTFWDGKTSPNTQRDVKHVAAWLRFSPSHFLGRQNARKQMFLCHVLGRQKLASVHPVGC